MCIYNVHVCVYGLYMSMKVTGQFQSVGREGGEGGREGERRRRQTAGDKKMGRKYGWSEGRREGVM